MAIRPDFARSAFLGLMLGFGLSACGNDSGAETSGNGATTNTTSGGNGGSNLAKGGNSSTNRASSSVGGATSNTGIVGGSGSGTAEAGGTSARTTSSEPAATSGGTRATSATSEVSGGKSAAGGTDGGTRSAGGGSGGKATTLGTATSSGSATGGRSSNGGTSSTGTAAGGKSTTGGAATGGNATGGKSAGGATTGGAATTTGGAATGGVATGGASTATGGAATTLDCNTKLPAYTTSTTVSATITISGTKDYGMQRFCADPTALGKGDQSESQKPVFMLAKGAVLKNVIIGGAGCSAADGVHCEAGSCTLENVWIGDVGEDAISFKGNDTSQVMTINGGGAFEADDKVIQHNGPGTIKVNGFYVQNAGKLYRSCGNCGTQYARHIELTNVFASNISSTLVGINYNLGDTATIHSLSRCGTVKTVCETFTGNDTGDEPTAKDKYTTAGDGTYCIYTAANILK